MSYTPGPWKYSKLEVDGVIIRRPNTFEINTPSYDVCATLPNGAPIRNEDDARLIAAAPDMHYALAIALEVIKNADPLNERFPQSRKIVVDALTKAAGLEPG